MTADPCRLRYVKSIACVLTMSDRILLSTPADRAGIQHSQFLLDKRPDLLAHGLDAIAIS